MHEDRRFTRARDAVEQTDHRRSAASHSRRCLSATRICSGESVFGSLMCHFLLWAAEALDLKALRRALFTQRA
jgi:hypothetical protein